MTPNGDVPPDVKRRRRVAAAVYVVVLVTISALVVWRLVSPLLDGGGALG